MTLSARLATTADRAFILDLIDDARGWLRGKDTDQWSYPWPCEEVRNQRIDLGIADRATWIFSWRDDPAATVTIYDRDGVGFWRETDPGREALYVHRLVVGRCYAGMGLGARILAWAVEMAAVRGIPEARIDVWTDNKELHRYYEWQGFEFFRCVPVEEIEELGLHGRPYTDVPYPSRALFLRDASYGENSRPRVGCAA